MNLLAKSILILLGNSPFTLSVLWDWTNSRDHDVSDILTGVLVLSGGEVSWDLGDVVGDLGEVADNVGGKNLDELHWVLEDFTPRLNSLDVTVHSLAVLEVVWKVLDDLTDLRDTLDDVSEVTLREVLNGGSDLLGNIWGVLEARLDGWEVLLSEETEDETVHEVDNIDWGNHWLWNVDLVENLHCYF